MVEALRLSNSRHERFLFVVRFADAERVFGNLAGIVHVWQEVSCNSGGHYTESAAADVL